MSYDQFENVWSFNTKRYLVTLCVADDDMDPAESFDDARDVEFARSGAPYAWFQARVQVIFKDDANPRNWAVKRRLVVGEDFLSGCSYSSLAGFMQPGGSFRDMVREAIWEARDKMCRMSLKPCAVRASEGVV